MHKTIPISRDKSKKSPKTQTLKTTTKPSQNQLKTRKCLKNTIKTRKLQFSTKAIEKTSNNDNPPIKKIQAASLKGTKDYFPDATFLYRHIQSEFEQRMAQYGYNNEIRTPILEHRDVFGSTLGADSDVVMKQMYQFDDYGIPTVLRPENTASVVRAVVKRGVLTQNNNNNDVKNNNNENIPTTIEYPDQLYYCGPMFRRERPQNGRLRQFTQFGVENIGSFHPYDDVQLISLAYDCISSLKMQDHVVLAINTIGTLEERKQYEVELTKYLQPFAHMLSPDSQKRFQNGHILRILDSSDETDLAIVRSGDYLSKNNNVLEILRKRHNDYRNGTVNVSSIDKDQQNQSELVQDSSSEENSNVVNPLTLPSSLPVDAPLPLNTGAPLLRHHLSDSSLQRFNTVINELHNLNIPYQIDDFLIRGLDYYSHTTFEFLVDQSTTEPIAQRFEPIKKHSIEKSLGQKFTSLTKSTPLSTLPIGSYQAILAGGRYGDIATRFDKYKPNSLALQPLNIGIGWASGLERVILHMERLNLITPEMIAKANKLVDVVVVTMGSKRQLIKSGYENFYKQFGPDDEFIEEAVRGHKNLLRGVEGDGNHIDEYTGVLNNVAWSFNDRHSYAMGHQMFTHHMISEYDNFHKKNNKSNKKIGDGKFDQDSTGTNKSPDTIQSVSTGTNKSSDTIQSVSNNTINDNNITDNIVEGDNKITNDDVPTVRPTLPYNPVEVEAMITSASLLVATKLRRNNNKVIFQPHLTYRQQLAATYGAKFAVIIGEEELARNSVLVKNMWSQQQELVPMDGVVQYMLMDSVFEEQMMQNYIMEHYDIRSPNGQDNHQNGIVDNDTVA